MSVCLPLSVSDHVWITREMCCFRRRPLLRCRSRREGWKGPWARWRPSFRSTRRIADGGSEDTRWTSWAAHTQSPRAPSLGMLGHRHPPVTVAGGASTHLVLVANITLSPRTGGKEAMSRTPLPTPALLPEGHKRPVDLLLVQRTRGRVGYGLGERGLRSPVCCPGSCPGGPHASHHP